MTSTPTARERWPRVEAILDEALEMPASERAAFLDQACAGDPRLRAEVEELLAADEEADGFMESPAGETLLGEAPPEARLEGRQLGPYRVERRVGAGGMGVVYEALDTRLHRPVALKVLPFAWGHDPEAKERFIREARAASALDHPNICTVYDVGEFDDGRIFMVMAYYRGETLKEKLQEGPLAIAEARDLAIQVARGLERAHEAGITHRDVKPANVMVPERGEAKILDFGIAKIAGEAGITGPGTTPATPAYLSPERALGQEADVRSDVWSLGVVLYEMLAGRRPFPGDQAHAVIYSILHREPEPLERLCPQVPAALARTVAKALAKDPAERYQSVAELLADLESGSAPAITAGARRRRRFRLAAAVLVGGLLAVGGGWWTIREPEPAAKPSIAVMPFQNLNGESEQDWLRRGLAELVIAALSQTREITVLRAGRVDQILEKHGISDTETLAFQELQKLEEEKSIDIVLEGSFIRRDDTYSIAFNAREVATGRELTTGKPERTDLFAIGDEICWSVQRSLQVPQTGSVKNITTFSSEAWRLLLKGRKLYDESMWDEARSKLDEAIKLDSDFALALADLGNLHSNLGHSDRAYEYFDSAHRKRDRLPPRERYFVDGEYYNNRWTSCDQAIGVLRRGLTDFPDDDTLQGNLAGVFADLERYEEAIQEYQAMINRGSRHAGTHYALAMIYGAKGDFEKGYQILETFTRANPDSWMGELGLGWLLTQGGRLDEAVGHLQKANQHKPGHYLVRNGWWRLRILQEDWNEADHDAQLLVDSSDSYGRWRGLICTARNHLYAGRSDEALHRFRESAGAYPGAKAYTALGHCLAAQLLLQTGQPAEALEEAEEAQEEARDQWPALRGMFLAALAQQRLGRSAEADRLAEMLSNRPAAANKRNVERRLLLHLSGRLALERGDAAGAVQVLNDAVGLLPPRGGQTHYHLEPDHVPLWYALGEAELAAGHQEKAADWFRKVSESGAEHIEFPVLFVRSHYQLGKIYEALGEPTKAAEAYKRFVGYWHNGDLDRDLIQDAKSASASGL